MKLALQGPSICNTRKGEDKYKESRIIGSDLFPTGKMSGYENNINSVLSPALGVWNLMHPWWVRGLPCQSAQACKRVLALHFLIKIRGWMKSAKLLPEQVHDFLVGKGLFINFPNKNILQVLSKNHK